MIFYEILIYPIEVFMQFTLHVISGYLPSLGFSIIILSLLVNVLLIPLHRLADRWKESEKSIKALMQNEIEKINAYYSGREKHYYIRAIYRRFGYNPFYAMRVSVGFLIQIPFFLAAYVFLYNYGGCQGVSFGVIHDLSKPDNLIGGFNLLPILMTLINLASGAIYARHMTRSEKIQLGALSVVFLVVLYTAPACLLVYWTTTNAVSLVKNILSSIRKRRSPPIERVASTPVSRARALLGKYSHRVGVLVRCRLSSNTAVVIVAFWMTILFGLVQYNLHVNAGAKGFALEMGILGLLVADFSYLRVFLVRNTVGLIVIVLQATVGVVFLLFTYLLCTRFIGVAQEENDKIAEILFLILFSATVFTAAYDVLSRRFRARQLAIESAGKPAHDRHSWLIVFFSGLFPALFFISSNLVMIPRLKDAAVITFAFVGMAYVFYNVIFLVFGRFTSKRNIVLLTAALTIVYSFTATLFAEEIYFEEEAARNIFVFIFITGALMLIFWIIPGMKIQRYILAILCIVALVDGLLKIRTEYQVDYPIDKAILTAEFKKKPNIYYILPDAYSNLKVLRDFEINISEFTTYLEREGFSLYPNFYGSYHATCPTSASLLNMAHHYYRQGEEHSELWGAREAGSGRNNLNTVLRRNGYRTKAMHFSSYLFNGQACHWDDCWPGTNMPLVLQETIIPEETARSEFPEEELLRQIEKSIESIRSGGKPTFVYIILKLPFHTHNRGKCDTKREAELYEKRVKEANKQLKWIIENVMSADKKALIIIASDHGPFLTNGCTTLRRVPKTPLPIWDRHGAFAAIRWGDTSRNEIYDERVVSTATIFNVVISYLAGKPELMDKAEANDAYTRIGKWTYKTFRNGKILWPPMKITGSKGKQKKKKVEQEKKAE